MGLPMSKSICNSSVWIRLLRPEGGTIGGETVGGLYNWSPPSNLMLKLNLDGSVVSTSRGWELFLVSIVRFQKQGWWLLV